MLQVGIVGLPNVGKSTLFNALTRSRKAQAANYPFCTIEPNVGVVEVPDARLHTLAHIAKTGVIIPAAIEFVDIAGLVAGASQGEGLGNQFLDNIRRVDAIVMVVRCFDDPDVVHTLGQVDPLRDIEVIHTELILADLQSAEKQLEKHKKRTKGADKDSLAYVALLEPLVAHLNAGKPAHTFMATGHEAEDLQRMQTLGLLSSKPVIFACNVPESHLADPGANPYVEAVKAYVKTHLETRAVLISAQLEADLSELDRDEARAFLQTLGVQDSGVSHLIAAAYELLGLASYFTAGEKEARAWTFRKGMKAPQCAGVIHGDFEKGFIKAEVVSYADLSTLGSVAAARQAGKYRMEGKDYTMQDGDVVHFRFSPS
jgi:GTP-binding protein YchF